MTYKNLQQFEADELREKRRIDRKIQRKIRRYHVQKSCKSEKARVETVSTVRKPTPSLPPKERDKLVPIMRGGGSSRLGETNCKGGKTEMSVNTHITVKALRNSPADRRLIAEVIADRASKWDFSHRKVWSAFRNVDEEVLIETYNTRDDLEFYLKVTDVCNERL